MLKLVELQLPFLLWLQGRKPFLSHFLSKNDNNNGNHDLCDDDDAEKSSSVEYFIPQICQAKQLHLSILSYSGSKRQKKDTLAPCLMPISVTPADL